MPQLISQAPPYSGEFLHVHIPFNYDIMFYPFGLSHLHFEALIVNISQRCSPKASCYTVWLQLLTMTISVPFFCAQRSTSLAMLWALEGVLWRLIWAGKEATVACLSQRLHTSAQAELRLDTASSQVA